VRLLDWWELRLAGERVSLGRREQRLVALLALNGRQSRAQVAAGLWPDSTDQRAMNSLRAAVWHTRHTVEGLVDGDDGTLALAPHVQVDVHDLSRLAAAVTAAPEAHDLDAAMPGLTGGQLLPDWFDDWVLFERERLEHARFRALDAVARCRLQRDRPDDAATAARAALQIEPLHEGENVLLVRALLASGDVVEAVRHFHAYRQRLAQELGIPPSAKLVELVRPLILPRQRDAVRPGQVSRK
jgi:DNA-binding SARP family transcriptional activator